MIINGIEDRIRAGHVRRIFVKGDEKDEENVAELRKAFENEFGKIPGSVCTMRDNTIRWTLNLPWVLTPKQAESVIAAIRSSPLADITGEDKPFT